MKLPCSSCRQHRICAIVGPGIADFLPIAQICTALGAEFVSTPLVFVVLIECKTADSA